MNMCSIFSSSDPPKESSHKSTPLIPAEKPCSETKSSDTCKPDMPPPPSPASSTCSDHSGPIQMSPASLSKYNCRGNFQPLRYR